MTYKSCGGSSASMMVTMLMFLLLQSLGCPTVGRAILSESGSTIASVLSSTSYQSKVKVIFCEQLLCDFFGHGYRMCYCCPTGDKKEYCHLTMEECRAVCPVCNPRCPKQSTQQNFP